MAQSTQEKDLFLSIARMAISQMSDSDLTSEIMETGSLIRQMQEVYGKDFYDEDEGMKGSVLDNFRKGANAFLRSLLSADCLLTEQQELRDWKDRLLKIESPKQSQTTLVANLDKSIAKLQKEIDSKRKEEADGQQPIPA